MRNFRLILLVVLILSLIVSLNYAKVKLTVIHPFGGKEWEKFEPVLKEAEKALGIEIEAKQLRSEDLITLLPTQWAGGMAPGDIIFITDAPLVRKGFKEGHVMDLTGLVDLSLFTPGAVDPLIVDGHVCGLTYTGKIKPGFWFRRSFFEKHSLKPPKNWEEFLELLEKIKKIPGIKAPIVSGDGVGWPLSDITEQFLVAFGGPELHKELSKCSCPENAWDVISGIFKGWLVPMLEKGYFSEPIEWTTALKMWWNGDYGLYFMGNWLTSMVDDPSDLGIFTIPGAKGVAGCIDFLFVSAHTKHPEEAKKLLKWLATEGQKVRVKYGGTIATYRNVPIDLYPPAEKMLAEKMAELVPLFDLDDAIGGEFQTTFWDQLKLLWVSPDRVDDVVDVLQEAWKNTCSRK
ncbi:MAG: carbohydrate ABC transporter substrate-binding protein [Thermotogae bacterium]|nr:carbohydrate ABC transporter substrate-binding protein [Thermotogota bacterium]